MSRARPHPGEESPTALHETAGSGFPKGESPQKIWRGGAQKRDESKVTSTHKVGLELSTVDTYAFQDLFDFDNETYRKILVSHR